MVLVSSRHNGMYFFFSGLYVVCSLLYLLIPSTSLNGLYHFKDKLCADFEALAELITIREIMQFNVRCLIFVKNFSAVGIGFFQFGFCLDEPVECFFEKENIWTFDGKGELLLTIVNSSNSNR